MTLRAEDFLSVIIFIFDVRVSALGDTSRKASHVPYRDSKLTRLLQVFKSQLFKVLYSLLYLTPVELNT
jgi:hypothetical protein